MRRLTGKLWVHYKVYYAEAVEYRAEIWLWAVAGVLPFILMNVWMNVAGGGKMAFTDAMDYARYFLAVFVVRNLSTVWVIWEFDHHITQGTLSHRLLQPMDPAWRFFVAHVAERIARLPFLLMIVAGFLVLMPDARYQPDPLLFIEGLLAIVGAFLLRFIMQYCMAMLAFWSERAIAIEQVFFLPFIFLSGLIGPLDDFPPGLAEAMMYTPFPYVTYFPAALLIGKEPVGGQVSPLLAFGVMIFWFFVFLALQRKLWRAGLKRYSAMGA